MKFKYFLRLCLLAAMAFTCFAQTSTEIDKDSNRTYISLGYHAPMRSWAPTELIAGLFLKNGFGIDLGMSYYHGWVPTAVFPPIEKWYFNFESRLYYNLLKQMPGKMPLTLTVYGLYGYVAGESDIHLSYDANYRHAWRMGIEISRVFTLFHRIEFIPSYSFYLQSYTETLYNNVSYVYNRPGHISELKFQYRNMFVFARSSGSSIRYFLDPNFNYGSKGLLGIGCEFKF